MEEKKNKKRRKWPWVVAILCLPVAVVGLLYLYAVLRANGILNEHKAEVESKIEQIRNSNMSRPVIFEPAKDANAWDHYRPALKTIGEMPPVDYDEFPSLRGDAGFKPDPKKVEGAIKKYSLAIAQLREGLSCRYVDSELEYEKGIWFDDEVYPHSIRASKLLKDAAVHRRRQGRDREAVELLLILLGISQDLARRGPSANEGIRRIMDSIGLWQFRQTLRRHVLSASDFEWLCGILERLEGNRPAWMECLRVDDTALRIFLLRVAEHGFEEIRKTLAIQVGEPDLSPGLDHLFSYRIMAAEALNHLKRYMEKLEEAQRLHPLKRPQASELAVSTAKGWGNRLFARIFLLRIAPDWKGRLMNDLDWTLARVSAAVAWFEAVNGKYPGTLQELVPRYLAKIPNDPYTGLRLGYLVRKTEARVYSLGEDKIDDGGKFMEKVDHEKDEDITWIIRRRSP